MPTGFYLFSGLAKPSYAVEFRDWDLLLEIVSLFFLSWAELVTTSTNWKTKLNANMLRRVNLGQVNTGKKTQRMSHHVTGNIVGKNPCELSFFCIKHPSGWHHLEKLHEFHEKSTCRGLEIVVCFCLRTLSHFFSQSVLPRPYLPLNDFLAFLHFINQMSYSP